MLVYKSPYLNSTYSTNGCCHDITLKAGQINAAAPSVACYPHVGDMRRIDKH